MGVRRLLDLFCDHMYGTERRRRRGKIEGDKLPIHARRGIVATTAAIALLLAPMAAFAESVGPVTLAGIVSSGAGAQLKPLSGAQVSVYQAGHAGPLAQGVANGNGGFSLSVTYERDAGILYAVARKGGAIELRTIIGEDISGRIVVNEMTTVASAYALVRILRNGAVPANPPLPARVAAGMADDLVSAATGLPSSLMRASPNANETNAWGLLGTLANMLANCVRHSGAACDTLFALTTLRERGSPPQKPATTWQAMLNIARRPAANVKPLFALSLPTRVYQPNLTAQFGPEAPNQFMRLDAFTLAIKFNASGRVDSNGKELCPFGGPGNFVFDTNGYIWMTNNVVQGTPGSAKCMIVLKPNGRPANGENGEPVSPVTGGGVLGQGFGLGFDPSGNMWSGNFGWGGVFPTDAKGNPGGSVSKFNGKGEPLSPAYGFTSNLYRVQGTVSDQYGDIWLASYGNSRVQIFPHGDPLTHYPFYADSNEGPFDIRLDRDGSGWVSYTQSSTVAKFTMTDRALLRQFTVHVGKNNQPKGIAVDSKGNGWISAGAGNAVYAFDKNGKRLGKFTGGGIAGPWGAAVDSDDIVWTANFGELRPELRKYSVSALCGATIRNCPPGVGFGQPISPATGYTLPSGGDEVHLRSGEPLYYPLQLKSYQPLMRLTAAHPDAAGNLWVTNNWKPAFVIDLTSNPGGDGVVAFVGLAAPVKPVLYSAPPVSPFAAN